MRKQVVRYFQLNVAERRGVFGFMAFGLLIYGASLLVRAMEQPAPADVVVLKEKATQFYAQTEPHSEGGAAAVAVQMVMFDPNTATVDELQGVGMPAWLAKRIDNYRTKGGKFKDADDLERIYGMPKDLYAQLAPYVQIGGGERGDKPIYADRKPEKSQAQLRDFDPNTCSDTDFLALGITERVARGIVNYRSKGGRFKQADDFKKVYNLPAEQFEQLKPYIKIATAVGTAIAQAGAVAPAMHSTKTYAPKPSVTVDINQATLEQWQELRGVGKFYAQRIIWHRDKFGGFANVDMVAKTKGLPDSVFQQIRPNLKPSPVLRQIAINAVDAKELSGHPLFDWKMSNIIVNYRTQHGNYSKITDLAKADERLNAAWLKELEPYVKF